MLARQRPFRSTAGSITRRSRNLTAIADAFPDLTIILNHTGTPILGGPYRDRQDEVRTQWLAAMSDLARRDNVYVKIGALPAKFGGRQQGTLAAAEFP